MKQWVAVVTTTDCRGQSHTWRISGTPAACPPDMVERRAMKRHWVLYGTPGIEVTQHGWEEIVADGGGPP